MNRIEHFGLCGSTFKTCDDDESEQTCARMLRMLDWIVRLWNVIGSVLFMHRLLSFHTLTCHCWASLSLIPLDKCGRPQISYDQFPKIFGGNCAPLKQNHIKHKSNTEFCNFEQNLRESERYQMTIVFNHWCMAKTISNAHLIRAARYNISTRNRKLINQTFSWDIAQFIS